MKALETQIAALPNRAEELVAIARRGAELRGEISFLLESEEKNYVYWFERRGKGVFLAATPIDVSGMLRERVFEALDTVVLTSATLAVGGRFDFLKQRLGIADGAGARAAAGVRFSQAGAAVRAGATSRRARSRFRGEGGRGDRRACWSAPRGARSACSPATAR